MIKTIRLLLEYNTYCIWLYDEDDEIIDNDNPPEWDSDIELTNAFMAVSDLYDTFFVDNEKEFMFIGCPDMETAQKLKDLFVTALDILNKKNNGKYIIKNDVSFDNLFVEK
ncbi:MAG: hypothetical protein HUJ67_03765 [Ruminiclostridium sp.]|nr:hypothetical protein [Ruminiclostridium sp.]